MPVKAIARRKTSRRMGKYIQINLDHYKKQV